MIKISLQQRSAPPAGNPVRCGAGRRGGGRGGVRGSGGRGGRLAPPAASGARTCVRAAPSTHATHCPPTTDIMIANML